MGPNEGTPMDNSSTEATHILKQKIDHLSNIQSEALRSATFVGMSPEEAKEYDARRQEITGLVKQLQSFENAL